MPLEETTAFYSTLALEKVESDGGAIAAGVDGNGIYDSFSALTYVDTAGATNLDSGTAGELKPALSSGSQAGLDTLANLGFNTNSATWSGYNFIQLIPQGALSRSGSKVRFRLRGPSTGSTVITGMRFEVQAPSGDNYDTAGTPVVVTVGSSANFTLATNADIWTDWIIFEFDETKNLVIKMHFDSSTTIRANLGVASGFNYYTKSGSTEVSTANVTGYTPGTDGRAFVVEQIQVASPQDLDVRSSATTLSAAPDWAELYAFVAPNTAVLNTDLIMSVSRDGTNFQAVTLSEAYTRLDGTKVLRSGRTNISAASGTTGKWRIQSANSKLPVVKAAGVVFGEAE